MFTSKTRKRAYTDNLPLNQQPGSLQSRDPLERVFFFFLQLVLSAASSVLFIPIAQQGRDRTLREAGAYNFHSSAGG